MIGSQRKLVIAGLVGNVLEWYDFSVYGLFEDLASAFEKTPTVEMRELVLQFCDERTVSYERREKMAELARACATRIFHLASRLEEPNLCAYRYCGTTYFRGRSKHAPGAKYCSRRCAELAGGGVSLE